jgi:hypothetical protein
MSKKNPIKGRKLRHKAPKLHDLAKDVSNMKYKDMQIVCITRGMLFEDVVSSDWHRLNQFYHDNLHVKPDRSLLDDFDDWMDGQMEGRGYDKDHPLRSKYLRKGFIGEYDEEGNIKEVKKPRIKGLQKVRVKKERNELGMIKGTKKDLTFTCFKEGKTLQETIKAVISSFPDAVEKSIRIWYNKAKKFQKVGK